MTQITGLDLSLTATGIARLVTTPGAGSFYTIENATASSTGHKGDTYHQRATRLETLKSEIVHDTTGADLIVIEGPSYGSTGGSTWDRAGLWWLVVSWLHGVAPVAVIPPTTLKKYATGKGTATKADMRVALYQRTQEDIRDDNQVDAYWLALAGAHHLGTPVVTLPAVNTAALDKAEWP